jgi:hypothetical protein
VSSNPVPDGRPVRTPAGGRRTDDSIASAA